MIAKEKVVAQVRVKIKKGIKRAPDSSDEKWGHIIMEETLLAYKAFSLGLVVDLSTSFLLLFWRAPAWGYAAVGAGRTSSNVNVMEALKLKTEAVRVPPIQFLAKRVIDPPFCLSAPGEGPKANRFTNTEPIVCCKVPSSFCRYQEGNDICQEYSRPSKIVKCQGSGGGVNHQKMAP